MDVSTTVTDQFESERPQLEGLAYRILGSAVEAEDAVQEAWLRLGSVDVETVLNLPGWLRTVTSRISLDMLRARRSHGETPSGDTVPEREQGDARFDPEREALLAESVGRALTVVLSRLSATERVAFVLHEMFAVPFTEIAPIVERTPDAAKKLASRARIKIRASADSVDDATRDDLVVVNEFLAASRDGDLDTVVAILDPNVVRRADRVVLGPDRELEVQGAVTVASEIAYFGANAAIAEPALIDGRVGLLIAPHGVLRTVVLFETIGGRVSRYELVAEPGRLAALEIMLLP